MFWHWQFNRTIESGDFFDSSKGQHFDFDTHCNARQIVNAKISNLIGFFALPRHISAFEFNWTDRSYRTDATADTVAKMRFLRNRKDSQHADKSANPFRSNVNSTVFFLSISTPILSNFYSTKIFV